MTSKYYLTSRLTHEIEKLLKMEYSQRFLFDHSLEENVGKKLQK